MSFLPSLPARRSARERLSEIPRGVIQADRVSRGVMRGPSPLSVGERELIAADRVKSPSRGSLIRQHRGLTTVAGSRRRRRSVGASVVSVA